MSTADDVVERAKEIIAQDMGVGDGSFTANRLAAANLLRQSATPAMAAPQATNLAESQIDHERRMISGAAHGFASAPVEVKDDFRGNNEKLIGSAKALLALDADGALVPHGIGGHARKIISAFVARYETAHASAPVEAAGMRELLMQSRDDLAKLIYMAREPGGATIGAWEIDQKERPVITGEYQGIALKVVNFICALPIPASPTDAAVKALQRIEREDRMEYSHARGPYAEIAAEALAANGVKR